MEIKGNYYDPASGNYTRGTLGTSFKQSAFGFGMGFTFNSYGDRTRPYFVFDYQKLTVSYEFESASTEFNSDEVININNTAVYDPSGKRGSDGVNLFRFGCGFQFAMGKKLALFNEASISTFRPNNNLTMSFAIDLGLRFFM